MHLGCRSFNCAYQNRWCSEGRNTNTADQNFDVSGRPSAPGIHLEIFRIELFDIIFFSNMFQLSSDESLLLSCCICNCWSTLETGKWYGVLSIVVHQTHNFYSSTAVSSGQSVNKTRTSPGLLQNCIKEHITIHV